MIELIGGLEWPFDQSQNLGPNCWNFRSSFGQSTDCLGCLCYDLCIKSCFSVNEAGNGH